MIYIINGRHIFRHNNHNYFDNYVDLYVQIKRFIYIEDLEIILILDSIFTNVDVQRPSAVNFI